MYYVYDPENGLERFEVESDAILAAKMRLEEYKDLSLNEWDSGVEHIAVFKQLFAAQDVSTVVEFEDWEIKAV